MPQMNKLIQSKSLGGKYPSRYYDGSTPYNSECVVEFYPQGSLQHINKDNLNLAAWNDQQDLQHVKNRTVNKDHLTEEASFIGLKDIMKKGQTAYEALQRLLKLGLLKPPVKLAPEFGAGISNLSLVQKKRRKKWINEEEGDFIPEAYLTHDPQMFYAKRMADGKKHKTNLVILAGGNCGITPLTLSFRAQVYAQVIDELQRQGHNVGVHCLDPIGSHRHDTLHHILWEVKRHEEQMSIPALQRDLGHAAVYRTAIFDIIGAAPRNPGGGLGFTSNNMFDHPIGKDNKIKETLKPLMNAISQELGEPTIILNLLHLDDNIKEDSMSEVLVDVQTQLTTLITQPKQHGIHIINPKSQTTNE